MDLVRFWRWRRSLGPAAAAAPGERFCAAMLGRVSRSFCLAIRLLPDALRLDVNVFYLTLRALDTLEDDMTLELGAKRRALAQFPACLGPDRPLPAVAGEGGRESAAAALCGGAAGV